MHLSLLRHLLIRLGFILLGGPGNTMFASFSGIMLVLGGSGITFGTSVLEDMVAKKLSGAARATCINFIWVVQQPCKYFSDGRPNTKPSRVD